MAPIIFSTILDENCTNSVKKTTPGSKKKCKTQPQVSSFVKSYYTLAFFKQFEQGSMYIKIKLCHGNHKCTFLLNCGVIYKPPTFNKPLKWLMPLPNIRQNRSGSSSV